MFIYVSSAFDKIIEIKAAHGTFKLLSNVLGGISGGCEWERWCEPESEVLGEAALGGEVDDRAGLKSFRVHWGAMIGYSGVSSTVPSSFTTWVSLVRLQESTYRSQINAYDHTNKDRGRVPHEEDSYMRYYLSWKSP